MLYVVSKTNTAATLSPRPERAPVLKLNRASASASKISVRQRSARRISSWNFSRRLVCSMLWRRNSMAAQGSGRCRAL